MKLACESIDRVLTTEIRLPFLTRGIIPAEYEAARAKIGGPISYAMASAILKCLEEGKNRVAVFTGVYHPENFPNGESDGPLGAAVVGNAIEKLGGDVTYCLEKETIPGTVHIFTSGQIGADPADGSMPATIEEQAELACRNVDAILKEAGSDLGLVLKTTCYLSDMSDFAAFNSVYAKYFVNKPARSCFAVKDLPKKALCEIEAIAVIERTK